jgi:hypothetical protein
MAAFRILDQSPVYFLLDGVTPAAGGRIEFYEAGTTTAKDVYGDKGLTVNNGSSIDLGSDGRPAVDGTPVAIWGSGSYRVRVYAADDTLISDDDDVEIPGGDGATIPALEAGKLLSNDGAVLEWTDIIQPPDPTGHSGKILGSDGEDYVWKDDGSPSVSGNGAQMGSLLIQTGTVTVTASHATTASKSFTFPTKFTTLWHVSASPNTGSDTTPIGLLPIVSVNGRSTSGATVNFDLNNFDSTIETDVPCTWFAIGTK